jgi:hypothetical protein
VTTYNPGTYCHGISISGSGSNVVFNSGLYFLGGTNSTTASNFPVTGGSINQTTVTAAAISTTGTGYKKNDTLTVSGGTFVSATTFRVSTVNGSGAITAFTVTSGAYTTSTPANPAVVTGGNGTGAKFTVTYAVPPATGLTFILTGSTATAVGSVSLANATITLIGMSTGATKNLIFWQDKRGTAANGFSGNPSARVTLQGALYFPNTTLSVAGNSTFIPTTCTAIVAKVISFTGQASITKGCLGIGGGTGGSMSAFRMAD